jgi:methionine salvage enolase-phosphatase E1
VTDDFFKHLMDLFNNPLFKKTFSDYMTHVQQQGLEAAQKYWFSQIKEQSSFSNLPTLFDNMVDFYSGMGFVSRKKYDEVVKENERLKKENAFLSDTIQKLNLRVMAEGGLKMQEAWKDTIDKQMDLSKEIAKNFFEIFKHHDKK